MFCYFENFVLVFAMRRMMVVCECPGRMLVVCNGTTSFYNSCILIYIPSRLYKVGLKFFTKPIDIDLQLIQLEVRAFVYKEKKNTNTNNINNKLMKCENAKSLRRDEWERRT
jgi:hypothetical protein